MIANTPVGHQTKVDLIRDGRQKSLTVTLAKRDENAKTVATPSQDTDELGIEVTDLDSDIARRFGIDAKETGVLVTDVKDGSLAREADVRPGDIVKEVNRTVVKDTNDFIRLIKKNQDGETIQLLIKRPNAGYVVVKIQRK
jgi:serine protease Do